MSDEATGALCYLCEQLNLELSDSLGPGVDCKTKRDRMWALRSAIKLLKKLNGVKS